MRKCVFQCGILIKLLLAGVVNARFTDYWAVNLEGGEDAARLIAEKFGFIYRGQVSTLCMCEILMLNYIYIVHSNVVFLLVRLCK